MTSQSVIHYRTRLSGNVSYFEVFFIGTTLIFYNRNLSRIINEFGALAIGGTINAQHHTTGPRHVLAHIEPFNLNSFDAVDLLHVSPSGNLVSIRSQEYNDGYFHINRFDFFLDTPSAMCLFTEST